MFSLFKLLFHSHGIGIQTRHFNKETLVLLPIFTLLFITLTHWHSFSFSLFLSLSLSLTHTLCASHAPSINGTLAPTHQHTCTHTCTHPDKDARTRTHAHTQTRTHAHAHTHVSIVWYTAVNFVLQHQSQPHDSFFQKEQRKSILDQKIENS